MEDSEPHGSARGLWRFHHGDLIVRKRPLEDGSSLSNPTPPARRIPLPDAKLGGDASAKSVLVPPELPDTWSQMWESPSARAYPTAVWTGTELIVWGGLSVIGLNTGGRYSPATDTWRPTSLSNAPAGRFYHAAIWTGNEMIIWGGQSAGGTSFNTGGRYNPAADTWTPMSAGGAPSVRYQVAVGWNGSNMFIWGGVDDSCNGVGTAPFTIRWRHLTTTPPALLPRR